MPFVTLNISELLMSPSAMHNMGLASSINVNITSSYVLYRHNVLFHNGHNDLVALLSSWTRRI